MSFLPIGLRRILRKDQHRTSQENYRAGNQRAHEHPLFVVISAGGAAFSPDRSEEHTSELQSQSNLVCRLLLEKKKRQGFRTQLRSPIQGKSDARRDDAT